jgi:cytochrome c-type biogenesis protein CcsB
LLDLILVPEHYEGQNLLYVKKKPFRMQLTDEIKARVPPDERSGVVSDAELARIVETGWVSSRFLEHPAVQSSLSTLERDLMRTNSQVRSLHSARALADPRVIFPMMRIIPEPGGDVEDRWYSISDLTGGRAPRDAMHAGMGGGGIPGLDREIADKLSESWASLASAWRFQDAEKANAAVEAIAWAAKAAHPSIYPETSRMAWEHWYYKNNKMTWVWLIYFASLPFLLLAIIYGVGWARPVGLALFLTAFVLHTFSIGLRWYLAGRIPNANMFEAITAAAWFGALTAIVLELILRRWPVKNIPALSAATAAMVALMVCRFQPVLVAGGDIGTVMPVLDRTIWLYIHVNIVIASYALIFFASVTGGLYLILRGLTWAFPASSLQRTWAGAVGVGAAGGGASSIILGRGMKPGEASNVGLARTLDGATMIFLELAFLSLWIGTILGAIWADVSWGRPWGWDPKEVFALNTWIVFLVLVHVRLKVKDKALWTAILAVIGCAVMLFNWVAVNFVIVGLHSYA